MVRRILIFILLASMGLAVLSCGGGSPLSPDDDTIRVLGLAFPKPLASLMAFTRDLPDSNNIYGINREIFVMRPDGSMVHRMTWDPGSDDYPAFAPNGHAIAFVSNRTSGGYGNHDIFCIGPWGDLYQFTDESWQFDASGTDWGPGFITAGRINTLIKAPFDVGQVIRINPFTGDQDYIDTGHIVSYEPSYGKSPNILAFGARPLGATYCDDIEIYLLRDDIAEAIRLTYFGDDSSDPTDLIFTTDPQIDRTGSMVIFQTTYWDGNTELAYIDLRNADYTPIRLTDNPGEDVEPCFDPTGGWFAWCSDRSGNFEIYKQMIYDPNSPTPVPPVIKITNTPEDEHNPDWGLMRPILKKYW